MEGICPDNKVREAARRCGYNETAATCLVHYRAGCCREKGGESLLAVRGDGQKDRIPLHLLE